MKEPVCKIVKPDGSICAGSHYKTFCYWNRKTQPKARNSTVKPLSERLGKEYVADKEDRINFIQMNGGIYATWECYLQISPMCLRIVDNSTLALEHVRPKGTHPELRHDPSNHRASCGPCNSLKGSSSLEYLAYIYPHLNKYLPL